MKTMTAPYLSSKRIKTKERLIVALDFDTEEEAKDLVDELGDSVIFYKLGLQLFMTGNYYDMVEWLVEKRKKVFVDLKFFDVPETVGSAIRQLRNKKADFATVHGNDAILKSAVEAKGNEGLKILAVTVLTSLDQHDLDDLGFKCDPKELVLSRARRALELKCDGVISSGLEASSIRDELGDNFLIVTPGIRPIKNIDTTANLEIDDQKRVVNVEEAFKNGADYIVVGRPIRLAQNRKKAAEDIQERIMKIFSETELT